MFFTLVLISFSARNKPVGSRVKSRYQCNCILVVVIAFFFFTPNSMFHDIITSPIYRNDNNTLETYNIAMLILFRALPNQFTTISTSH